MIIRVTILIILIAKRTPSLESEPEPESIHRQPLDGLGAPEGREDLNLKPRMQVRMRMQVRVHPGPGRCTCGGMAAPHGRAVDREVEIAKQWNWG